MIIVRWLTGLIKGLFGIWNKFEWEYYTATGLDPKLPAFDRFEVVLRTADKTPETETERVLPRKNRTVVLKDKYHQMPDEIIFFDTDADRSGAVIQEYDRKMKTLSAGEFYVKMVRHRDLEFIHTMRFETESITSVSNEELAEQEREKFLR
jgi:hypothetical protein